MKLPRYHNPTSSAAAADALARGREPDQHRLQNEGTPRAGNLGVDSASHASMRRCQSAAASQQQRRPSNHHRHRGTNLHKSRSHSSGPVSSLHKLTRAQPTQELPIPPSQRLHGYHHQASSLSNGADKTDLTRMYDYATWNMYERIVSARRRRLSEMDQQGSPTSSSGASSSRRASELDASRDSSRDGVKSSTAAAGGGGSKFASAKSTKQLLPKTSSTDDSTLATADETDKSSTTSSSWSRTDSPHTYPGVAFNYVRDVSSCPPPGEHNKLRTDDEHFIFELDM